MSPDPALAFYLPTIIWAVTAATIALVVTLGAVLTYHWHHYAMNKGMTIFAITVYAIGSVVLIISLIGAASFI